MGRCATIAYVIAETILDNICDPYAGLLYKILTHQIGNYKGKPTSASAQGPWGSLVSFQLWELVTPVQIWADPLFMFIIIFRCATICSADRLTPMQESLKYIIACVLGDCIRPRTKQTPVAFMENWEVRRE